MTWHDTHPPDCREGHPDASCLEQVLTGTEKDLGGLVVRRVLPARARRRVGPFLFFDHFGPAQVAAGGGMDVRPHPHIHLATVTYLFEGAVLHYDSLGSEKRIEPGAINLMHAGRGIVHSERTPADLRGRSFGLHGLQLWLGLPQEAEDTDPAFSHHPAGTIPQHEDPSRGVVLRQLLGEAYGLASPVPTSSPLFYTDVLLAPGASIAAPEGYEERAAYVVSGAVSCEGTEYGPGTMLVFRAGGSPLLEAGTEGEARLVMLGGAPLEGERYMWWNFVSSDPVQLEQAKRAWKRREFPAVPGDAEAFIPLPEETPHVLHVPSREDGGGGGEFVIFQQGEPLGELTWRSVDDGSGQVMDIVHTGVRDALQGQGWARRLVEAAVRHARQQGMVILPHCSYARKVLTEDAGMREVLAEGWQARL